MRSSTRMVCADCLRSAEPGSGEGADGPFTCPHCGGRVESVSDLIGGSRENEEDAPFLGPDLSEDLHWREDAVGRSTMEIAAVGNLGRFQLREMLGGGAFGWVYRAYDPRLDRDVALKILNDTKPTARHLERFFREARAAAQLDHPNIVPLHDAGRDCDRCWIAYQYVPGLSLARKAEAEPLTVEKSARVVRALADALHHAHERGVCHRDVKPANVLIDRDGRPRLTDFGLAKRLDIHSSLTKEGAILGTPAYMAPEQAAGHGNLADPRSDIYSLGVTLYELLSGRRPVDLPSGVPSWRAIGALRATQSYKPPSTHNRNVPRALDLICRRAMALDPQDRYPDAAALADDLDRWIKRPKWTRFWVGGAACLVVVGAFAGDIAVHLRRGAPPDQAVATKEVGGAVESPLIIAPAPPGAPRQVRTHPVVVGNRGSRVYHRPECQSIAAMSDERRVEFDSEAEAIESNYKPCFYCHKDRDKEKERGVSREAPEGPQDAP